MITYEIKSGMRRHIDRDRSECNLMQHILIIAGGALGGDDDTG